MNKDFPVGAAQAKVLAALGLTANGFNEAKAVFEKIGLSVSSKRVGRASVPEIYLVDVVGGGFNAAGDGETWTVTFQAIDLTPVLQWIVTGDQPEAQRRIAAAQRQETPLFAPDTLSTAVQAEQHAETVARRAEEVRRKEERRVWHAQRSRLYAAGYRWRNLGNGDDVEDDWTLYAPTGEPVTMAEALTALDAR
jgi:hypothetical protein